MNSAFTRKINMLNRSQLITVAKKLGITGMTNKRKDDIRNGILKFIKTRRNSTSTLETIKMVPSVSKRPLQRSKSDSSVSSNRLYRPKQVLTLVLLKAKYFQSTIVVFLQLKDLFV